MLQHLLIFLVTKVKVLGKFAFSFGAFVKPVVLVYDNIFNINAKDFCESIICFTSNQMGQMTRRTSDEDAWVLLYATRCNWISGTNHSIGIINTKTNNIFPKDSIFFKHGVSFTTIFTRRSANILKMIGHFFWAFYVKYSDPSLYRGSLFAASLFHRFC